MINQTPTFPEIDQTPESQFEQTVGYFNRILDEHGRTPVPGEIGEDTFARQMQIDPKGTGYSPYYIRVTEKPDGTHQVYDTYHTYTFNPKAGRATDTYYMWPSTPGGPSMKPEVKDMDDGAMRELIIKISDAQHNGNVVDDKPVFPPRGVLARLGLIASKPPKGSTHAK